MKEFDVEDDDYDENDIQHDVEQLDVQEDMEQLADARTGAQFVAHPLRRSTTLVGHGSRLWLGVVCGLWTRLWITLGVTTTQVQKGKGRADSDDEHHARQPRVSSVVGGDDFADDHALCDSDMVEAFDARMEGTGLEQ